MSVKIGHKHIIYRVHIWNNGNKKEQEKANQIKQLNANVRMHMTGHKTISVTHK